MGKKTWTDAEEKLLSLYYKEKKSVNEISKLLNKTTNSIIAKAAKMNLADKYMKNNNPKFKAIYQDYEWCYQKYIIEGKSHIEMAKEANCSLRVIQKWCSEKHKLNKRTFKENKRLSDKQRELIMFSLLGDGHIDKRETQPIFIISHAENQKDYLYWKYDILKDLCQSEPMYYSECYSTFSTGEQYLCKPHYRFGTRIINDLIPIREMSKSEIINQLNEFGICIHLLDDGSRSNSNWQVCVADFNELDKELYIKKCKEDLSLNCHTLKDDRYIQFDAISSRKIDELILSYLPNDLDIVKYKIIDKDICKPANYFYVHTNDGDIGLNNYCRKNKLSYLKTKGRLDLLGYKEINECELLEIMECV